MEELWNLVKSKMAEIAGYGIGGWNWLVKNAPGTCDDWSSLVGLVVVLITLFCITIPKAYQNLRKK